MRYILAQQPSDIRREGTHVKFRKETRIEVICCPVRGKVARRKGVTRNEKLRALGLKCLHLKDERWVGLKNPFGLRYPTLVTLG